MFQPATEEKFTCVYCDMIFASKRKRKSHIHDVHKEKISTKCDFCNESFKSIKDAIFELVGLFVQK